MTKISVDKEELKTIRDNIDSLLEKGKQSLAAYTQQPIYESYDLNDKEQLIIEYLNKNPGNTKEQVTTGLSRHYSRMPIRDNIDALIERAHVHFSKQKGFDSDPGNRHSAEYNKQYVNGYNDGWVDARNGVQDPKC